MLSSDLDHFIAWFPNKVYIVKRQSCMIMWNVDAHFDLTCYANPSRSCRALAVTKSVALIVLINCVYPTRYRVFAACVRNASAKHNASGQHESATRNARSDICLQKLPHESRALLCIAYRF